VSRFWWVFWPVVIACVGSRSSPALTRADVHTDQLASNCGRADLEACESLGEIYLQLEPPDVRQAELALRRACKGRTQSCKTLARLFAQQGRARDAELMRQQACALGSADSCPAPPVSIERPAAPKESAPAAAHSGASIPSGSSPSPSPTRQLIGSGTCFAVSPDGLIATARHVVEDVDTIAVQFEDEPYRIAKIVRWSSATDLAVIKVERPTSSFIRVPSKSTTALGVQVFTIGFPVPDTLGFEPKFASGTVAATTARGEDHRLQIQIPAYPGNSGGALLSENGHFVGVIVARERDDRFYQETGTMAQQITYAVKADYLAAMLSPSSATPSLIREKAIELGRRSTCKVLTLKTK
jgi:S1-C subfamily serine protease